MRNRSPRCLLFSAGLLAVMSLIAVAPRSEARPLYKKAFDTVYADIAKQKTTCAICHHGDSKKNLNHYGQALAEELGEKNVKDMDKILEAIKAIGKRKCKSGPWKERLERHLPPCVCRDFSLESYVDRQLQGHR